MNRLPWEAAWKVTLRLAGLAVIVNEALSSTPGERPFLYVVACAMMGVTITIPADRKRSKDDDA